MATTYTATGYSTDTPISYAEGTITRKKTYEVATALVINDVIQFFKLPRFAKPLDALLACDDLDTGSAITLTLRITDGTTTKNFFSASTVGQAGGVARMDLLAALDDWETDNDDYRFEVLVAAAPSGGGTGTVVAWLQYTMDLENEE